MRPVVIVGAVLPIATMYYAIAMLESPTRRPSWVWRLPLAVGAGIGISSVPWWGLLLAGASSRHTLVFVDAGLWSACLVLAIFMTHRAARRTARYRGGQELTPGPERFGRFPIGPLVALSSVAMVSVVSFAAQSIVLPHGTWDAWAIWNLKARFLARGASLGAWRAAFDTTLAWSHPDYPLLLPLSVARAWTYSDSESALFPIACAALFAAAAVATLGVSVARARGVGNGLLAATFLAASPALAKYAPSQYADIPLSYFILATFVAMMEAERHENAFRLWAAAGLASGLAAWTKNEGLMFFGIACLTCVVGAACEGRFARKRVPLFLLGAAPALVPAIGLKTLIAPANEVVGPQTAARLFGLLSDPTRITTVLAALSGELWLGGARVIGVVPILGIYVLLRGVRRPLERSVQYSLAIVTATLLAYAAVYLVTPYDLGWHLRTSVDRVVLQLLPSIIWIGFMIANGHRIGGSDINAR